MRNTKKVREDSDVSDGGILKQVLPAVEGAGSLESGVLCLTSGTPTDWPQTSLLFYEN